MSTKILIVEDEPKVAAFIKQGLEENNYEVEIAYDGLVGKNMALTNHYDVFILDINLPHINGFELCKLIRSQKPEIPIIMLSALGTVDDKLIGFDSGADDYMIKPFEFRELLARIKALLKRKSQIQLQNHILTVADLEINLETKTVKRAEKKIDLTAKEFMLLEFFVRNKGRLLSRSTIAEKVWDITFDTGTNVIDVYINFLRKKIDKDFSQKLIHTQIGMGYIFKVDE